MSGTASNEETDMAPTDASSRSLMRTSLVVAGVLLVCAVAIIVSLVQRPAGGLSLPHAYRVVHVDEYDMGFKMSNTTLPAGDIVFVDTNRGKIAHEFVLFKTDARAAHLPLKTDANVNEDSDALEDVADSGSSLAPGEVRLITADLEPGHYALVCNLDGHYKAGMRVDITVK
jgi:uncharacterized cupredoxin-like copper-binding protein